MLKLRMIATKSPNRRVPSFRMYLSMIVLKIAEFNWKPTSKSASFSRSAFRMPLFSFVLFLNTECQVFKLQKNSKQKIWNIDWNCEKFQKEWNFRSHSYCHFRSLFDTIFTRIALSTNMIGTVLFFYETHDLWVSRGLTCTSGSWNRRSWSGPCHCCQRQRPPDGRPPDKHNSWCNLQKKILKFSSPKSVIIVLNKYLKILNFLLRIEKFNAWKWPLLLRV